jgi:hypothetical protein
MQARPDTVIPLNNIAAENLPASADELSKALDKLEQLTKPEEDAHG